MTLGPLLRLIASEEGYGYRGSYANKYRRLKINSKSSAMSYWFQEVTPGGIVSNVRIQVYQDKPLEIYFMNLNDKIGRYLKIDLCHPDSVNKLRSLFVDSKGAKCGIITSVKNQTKAVASYLISLTSFMTRWILK